MEHITSPPMGWVNIDCSIYHVLTASMHCNITKVRFICVGWRISSSYRIRCTKRTPEVEVVPQDNNTERVSHLNKIGRLLYTTAQCSPRRKRSPQKQKMICGIFTNKNLNSIEWNHRSWDQSIIATIVWLIHPHLWRSTISSAPNTKTSPTHPHRCDWN